MSIQTMFDVDLSEKRVLLREDLNVPMKDGKITNDARIQRALPAIKYAIEQNAKLILLSHLGRPTEGEYEEQYSMKPVAEALSQLLNQTVRVEKDWLDGVEVEPGQVVLCENVRFNKGEKKNNPELAKKIASLGDVFVMDAFATSHRAQATTCGAGEFAAIACAGPLLMEEVKALTQALEKPEHPVMAIIGGSKVSTKTAVINSVMEKVDALLLGGGIANTFLKAQGYEIGKSLYEPDFVNDAKLMIEKAKQLNVKLLLPLDVVVANEMSEEADARTSELSDVKADESIFDIGSKSIAHYVDVIAQMKTILWNGPVGVFELKPFENGTRELGQAIAKASAFSVAGGGDTLAALAQFGIMDKISYVSTAGGAFLEWLEGKALPAIEMLKKRAEG